MINRKQTNCINLIHIDTNKKSSIQRNTSFTQNFTPQIDQRWMEFKMADKNIPSRTSHISAVYQNYLYVQGGYNVDQGILQDFYKLNLEGGHQGFLWEKIDKIDPDYPGKLKNHSCVLYQNKLILFGGQRKDKLNSNSTFIYNILSEKWTKVQPNIDIPSLDSHSAFLYQNNMIIYGGYISDKAQYNQNFYSFDLKALKWSIFSQKSPLEPHPSERSSCSMVEYKDSAFLFGGQSGTSTFNDFWKFDLRNKKWTEIKSENTPEPRKNHSMITFKDHLFIFGGIEKLTKQKNDICVYSPSTNSWTKIQSSTNSAFQCSPTLKKSIIKPKDSQKGSILKNKKTISNISQATSPFKSQSNELMKKVMQEVKQKKFLEKKKQLLKQFSSKPDNQRKLSPTNQHLKKKIQSLGDQQQSKLMVQHEAIYDNTKRFLLGKKPCARDGHSLSIWQNKMIIFGGDRHQMLFSDVYSFDLDKGLASKELYAKK